MPMVSMMVGDLVDVDVRVHSVIGCIVDVMDVVVIVWRVVCGLWEIDVDGRARDSADPKLFNIFDVRDMCAMFTRFPIADHYHRF